MQLSIIGHMSYDDFKSSDITWLAPLVEDNNWNAMRIVIVGATTLGFKSWKEACDIKALKDQLINDCNEMDRNDIISICDDEDLIMDKKCFFERAREFKEALQIYNYASYCAQGVSSYGNQAGHSFCASSLQGSRCIRS